jgi:Response regulator receiver domain
MSKRVVAVIDDDLSMRTSLAHLLRAKGYDCESCGSAEEFLDGFATSNANCVLIDIHLGSGLSGIQLCKRLRESGRSLNVILMTGVDTIWAGGSLPAASSLLIGLGVGFVGYGLSLVLFVMALRNLGTARTSASFTFFDAVGWLRLLDK